MSTIGSAFVQVRADVSRFASEAADGVKKAGPAVKAGISGALKFSAVAGAALAGITVFGTKSAASLEQTTTAFTSLLGSSTKANDMIRQLQQFAASTPFEFSDVAGYAQQFLAMHDNVGLAQDQLIPFLKTVGDLGSATGASTDAIHNAIMAISQAGSVGKLQGDNLNQIAQAFPGFNAAAAIAANTGQSVAQVMQQMKKGALDAKTAIPALLKGMQQFQGAAGAMQKQGQTLNGLLSTFADTLKINLTTSLNQSIPVIKDTLNTITPAIGDALNALAPALAQLIHAIAPIIGPLVQGVGSILTTFAKAIAPALHNLIPLIKPLAAAFSNLIRAAAPLVDVFTQVLAKIGPPLFKAIGDIADTVGNNLMPALEPLIQVLGSALVEAINAVAPLLDGIVKVFAALLPALEPVINALAGALMQVLHMLAPYIPQLTAAIVQMAVAFGKILVALMPLLPPLVQLLGLVIKIGGPVLVTLAKLLAGVASLFADVLGPAATAVAGAFRGVWSVAGDVFDLFKKWGPKALLVLAPFIAIPLIIKNHFTAIKGWLRQIWNDTVGLVKQAVNNIVSFFAGLPGRIRGAAAAIGNAGKWLAVTLWNGLKTIVTEVGDLGRSLYNMIASSINHGLIDPIKHWHFTIGAFGISHTFQPFGGIPDIPLLAKGGMTQGFTLAGIGDNPSGHEAVLPMDSPKTVKMFRDVLEQASIGGGGNLADAHDAQLAHLTAQVAALTAAVGDLASRPAVFKVDSREIARANDTGQLLLGRRR